MAMQGLGFLPLLWFTWTCIGVVITLALTIHGGHIKKFIPCISDTGANTPESTVFTVVLSISAILGAWTVYVVYKLMRIRSTEMTNANSLWHRLLLLVGWTSCCGKMLVGLFQGQYYPIIHSEGALLAFGMGIVYITCQALILYPVSRSSRVTSHLRMAMSLATLISFIIMVTCRLMLVYKVGDERHCEMVNRVSEWILAFLYISNFLTYITDFQHLCIKCTRGCQEDWICLREKMHDGPEYP